MYYTPNKDLIVNPYFIIKNTNDYFLNDQKYLSLFTELKKKITYKSLIKPNKEINSIINLDEEFLFILLKNEYKYYFIKYSYITFFYIFSTILTFFGQKSKSSVHEIEPWMKNMRLEKCSKNLLKNSKSIISKVPKFLNYFVRFGKVRVGYIYVISYKCLM